MVPHPEIQPPRSVETVSSPNILQQCLDLEAFYAVDAASAEETGFFLPGADIDLYKDFADSGCIRVITDTSGVAAYIAILPPGHDRIASMLAMSDKVIFFERAAPDPAKLFWIAKIAVRPDMTHQGLAKLLYGFAFAHYQGYTGMTATALGPVRNLPSEKLQSSAGMRRCGLFFSGQKGHLRNTINTLWISS